MIYKNIVRTNNPMEMLPFERDFDFFKSYYPQEFTYPRNSEEKDKIKQFQMYILIAGEMVPNSTRSNDNVLSRSLLFIDLDDVNETETEFLQKISNKLSKVNYCLYPTLSHITNEKIRYRLVLELDRSVNRLEYETLLLGISSDLGIDFDVDESNKVWSQGQGAPVFTEKSKNSPIFYQEKEKPVPVDNFLKKIKESSIYKKNKRNQASYKGFDNYQYTGEKYTGKLLNKIAEGVTEGDRNIWFTSLLGSFFNQGVTAENAYKLATVINENFLDFPLEDKELITIFKSIMARELRKRGGEIDKPIT
ncbi:primase alpha helix C-terminal domain-containing protein [Vagococcus xieshaowenii]|uniref:Primase C-terminal 1 domain-containing protein n=1 Tax=Vagococcus xieshaowenii TaxID=2562451 RepID=A0A4Z0D7L1_9ENTE|nr:primase alpha helix C-terminal domain-containing protein [Vagococcus xieshaowenii]QCA29165.1 hypothetical protein E4Z98_07495 [Vagococcus xieshaowenii]TFZ40857.1 hypothetical protein E4031_05595 [Vagococcus xieshaowenii]